MAPELKTQFSLLGPTSVEIQSAKMLTLIGGLFCVGFINPIGVVAGIRRQRLALFIGPT
jgi:hypothetical protein